MSDFVALLISFNAAAKFCVFISFQSFTYRVWSAIRPCKVLTFDDIRLNMFVSFLLYTNAMLTAAILARMTKDDKNRMMFILVLK